jgi:tRNA uridine 5-carbamoylmethylation protein Kti12
MLKVSSFSENLMEAFPIITTSVACALGPSVNPLQNRETQHVNNVLQCMYRFFEQPNMKRNHA